MTNPNQRHANRSSLDRQIEVLDIESGIGFRAEGVDVSEGGLAFHAPMEPAMGAQMYVTVRGAAQAQFKVLRVEPRQSGFTVAGSIGSH